MKEDSSEVQEQCYCKVHVKNQPALYDKALITERNISSNEAYMSHPHVSIATW
jgi:hypothetical protein